MGKLYVHYHHSGHPFPISLLAIIATELSSARICNLVEYFDLHYSTYLNATLLPASYCVKPLCTTV